MRLVTSMASRGHQACVMQRRTIDEGHPIGKGVGEHGGYRHPSRVLPTPPGPVSVSSRTAERAGSNWAVAAATSDSRPISAGPFGEDLLRQSGMASQPPQLAAQRR